MEKMVIISELVRYLMESSDSDSSDNEEVFLMIAKLYIMPHIRCQNYVEDIVPLYTDKEFQMHFR